ncbi:MAG: matrixin family metalloprotease, partial [Pseudobdellovibrionaceae bacterium]
NPVAGISGGYAKPAFVGKSIDKCEIEALEKHSKKAKFLTHLLTHEIGHCFGLMHPQEGTHSVMSYFAGQFARLQNDDYAGITYRYPDVEDYAKEESTLGLTGCSPK